MPVRIIGENNRYLLEPIQAVYFGGEAVALLDAQGNSLIGELPAAPTIISTIADREYTVGGSSVTIDLATKFAGATSYSVTPQPAGVSLSGAIMTINPTTALAETAITVRGVNSGGQSDPLVFSLTVRIPAPTLTAALPDISLIQGEASVVTDLREHFEGAASYAVSPTEQGVTISGYTMTISAAAERDAEITVTATNSTGSVSDTFALLVAAQPTLTATLSPNPPIAGEVLTITFSAAPDSATATLDGSAVTLEGTGTTRTLTPASEGDLVITFAREGYTSTPLAVEVQPAVDPGDDSINYTYQDGEPAIAVNSSTGDMVWTWEQPAEVAGVYDTDQSEEYSGNLNANYTRTIAAQCIWPPKLIRVIGSVDQANHAGYQYIPGAWQYDDNNGPLVVTPELLLDGVNQEASAGDIFYPTDGGALVAREMVTQAGMPARSSNSIAINVIQLESSETVFAAPDDTLIETAWDTTGRYWRTTTSGTSRFKIFNNYLRKTAGVGSLQAAIALDDLPADQEAYVRFRVPDLLADFATLHSQGAVVRYQNPTTTNTDTRGYAVRWVHTGGIVRIAITKVTSTANNAATTTLWSTADMDPTDFLGDDLVLGIRAVGDQISGLLNGEVLQTVTDAEITTGQAGAVCYAVASTTASQNINGGIYAFDCWGL